MKTFITWRPIGPGLPLWTWQVFDESGHLMASSSEAFRDDACAAAERYKRAQRRGRQRWRRWVGIAVEGWHFLRAITPRGRLLPTRAYLHWRLGTVYGSFDRETGAERSILALLRDLWNDRENAARFILWRRSMLRR